MTPDEARKDCWCESYRKPCEYHEGYRDGYEAAQRERGEAEAKVKQRADSPGMPPHFASETPQGRPGS